jgi:hypothetical protein
MIVIWHKNGIDTIICNIQREKLANVDAGCDGFMVNLNLSEPPFIPYIRQYLRS